MAEDMLEAARTGYFAERVRRNNETTPTANNVLGWATTGGAEITNSTGHKAESVRPSGSDQQTARAPVQEYPCSDRGRQGPQWLT